MPEWTCSTRSRLASDRVRPHEAAAVGVERRNADVAVVEVWRPAGISGDRVALAEEVGLNADRLPVERAAELAYPLVLGGIPADGGDAAALLVGFAVGLVGDVNGYGDSALNCFVSQ